MRDPGEVAPFDSRLSTRAYTERIRNNKSAYGKSRGGWIRAKCSRSGITKLHQKIVVFTEIEVGIQDRAVGFDERIELARKLTLPD